MKKFLIQITLLLITAGISIYYIFQPGFLGEGFTPGFINYPGTARDQVKIGDTLINVEISDTPEKRNKGLSGRGSIASDSGMLFVFDNPTKPRFWMKDMKFPIDIIYISNQKVVDLLKNIPPPSPNQSDDTLLLYEPVTIIDQAVEVNGGFVSSHGISIGDTVQVLRNTPR